MFRFRLRRDWADDRSEASGIKPLSGPTKPRKHLIDPDLPDIYRSKGFVDDLKTGRWMLIPGTSPLTLME
jgi:hypothetical protein